MAAEVKLASAKPARGAAPRRQLGREREASWALAAQCAAVLRAVHAWLDWQHDRVCAIDDRFPSKGCQFAHWFAREGPFNE